MCTEFDWENYRIKLGNKWKDTKSNISGGLALSRATMAHLISKNDNDDTQRGWNINPKLQISEKERLRDLLNAFNDVFALILRDQVLQF